MSRGVTRDLSIRAQEQLEKQERLVERYKTRLTEMYREMAQLEAEMAAEQEILEYYRNHPVLQAKQRQDFNDKHVGNMEELLLPLALEEMK